LIPLKSTQIIVAHVLQEPTPVRKSKALAGSANRLPQADRRDGGDFR